LDMTKNFTSSDIRTIINEKEEHLAEINILLVLLFNLVFLMFSIFLKL